MSQSYLEIMAQIEKLKAEAKAAKPKAERTISFKVTAKGGVSVYGLGKFPVTLYKTQWEKLMASSDALKAFLTVNDASLSVKATPVQTEMVINTDEKQSA